METPQQEIMLIVGGRDILWNWSQLPYSGWLLALSVHCSCALI